MIYNSVKEQTRKFEDQENAFRMESRYHRYNQSMDGSTRPPTTIHNNNTNTNKQYPQSTKQSRCNSQEEVPILVNSTHISKKEFVVQVPDPSPRGKISKLRNSMNPNFISPILRNFELKLPG